MSADRRLEALILAAGQGTRMHSDLPKVLHPVAGRPMLDWVIDAALGAGAERAVVVVGEQAERVREAAARPRCTFVEQTERLGTGHAVWVTRPLYEDAAPTDLLVLCGDGPLIRPATLSRLVDAHRDAGCDATLATAWLDDPTGYGRIKRDASGRFERIVEDRDATEEERAIREINPSYYCFAAGSLFRALERVDNNNTKGEYYLTDTLGIFAREGAGVSVVPTVPSDEVLSVNTPQQLHAVDSILTERRER